MLGFRWTEVAADFDRSRVNIRHIRRLAVESYVLLFFVAESRPNGSAGTGADFSTRGACFGNGSHVVNFNFPVFQRFDDDGEVGDGERCARNLEHVGAEVGNLLFNIEVRALDNGHDRDERGHAHGQSQRCKRSAQLVPAQSFEALREIVADSKHGKKVSSVTLSNSAKI